MEGVGWGRGLTQALGRVLGANCLHISPCVSVLLKNKSFFFAKQDDKVLFFSNLRWGLLLLGSVSWLLMFLLATRSKEAGGSAGGGKPAKRQ